MDYRSPLSIYVIWHPDYKFGEEISKKLFGAFCRDLEHPLDQRLGIPTFFRSAVFDDGQPLKIDFIEAQRTIVVCLIDDKVVLDRRFKEYVIEAFSAASKQSNTRFIPVAVSKSAYNLDQEVGKLNYIRCDSASIKDDGDTFEVLYHNLLHEMCKAFISRENLRAALPPIKMFISHSKHDKETLAEAASLRDFVNSNTQLKTFFDANDIGYGEDFAKTIEENAQKCVVVAFLSDTFSSREWCRNEIIISKKNHCPIIVINAIEKGERRSFPYMGNVPTKKWTGKIQEVVTLALETTLTSLFTKEALKNQAELFNVPNDIVLATSPELFNIIGIKQKILQQGKEAAIVLYPDPPLGNEELNLLNEMDDRLTFITPLQLSTFVSYD